MGPSEQFSGAMLRQDGAGKLWQVSDESSLILFQKLAIIHYHSKETSLQDHNSDGCFAGLDMSQTEDNDSSMTLDDVCFLLSNHHRNVVEEKLGS